MRSKKQKQQVPVGYKSSTWTTEIKGDINNPTVRNLIIADFIVIWLMIIIRVAIFILSACGIINQVAKRLNIHQVYQFSNADRKVFLQLLSELKNCFAILQKYLDQIKPK